jgi:allophanate hydrolase
MGVIPQVQLNFFGDHAYEKAYQKTLYRLSKEGSEFVEIDYTPFEEAAKLLYQGPWFAEHYIAIKPLIGENPDAIFPVVRDIMALGGGPKATALFAAAYRLNALKQVCHQILAQFDCLLTPTAGKCFTIDEMLEEPILRNTQLGYYTNFMNLLDMASVANRIYAGTGLKAGVLAFNVSSLDAVAVSDTDCIDALVCGAHLEGLLLNWQLKERGARFTSKTQTAPVYRMYALAGGHLLGRV